MIVAFYSYLYNQNIYQNMANRELIEQAKSGSC